MKKILLLWYMENDNFGDVLIYDTVSSYLIKKGYCVECHEVGDSSLEIIKHANQCNFMLFAGGGIIERYIPEIIRDFKQNYKKLEVPYGVIGFGMGIFDYSKYFPSIKLWVCQSAFFYVRDEATKKQLDIISESQKVIYSGDCVFANTKIYDLNKEVNSVRNGGGVNMRDLPYQDITGDFDWNIINNVLKECNCKTIISDSSKDSLKISITDSANISKERNEFTPIEKARITINEINQCEWIIAMRFHVVLVAALLGIPSVPIMYCPKVRYLAEQLDIIDLALDIDEYENIPEKVKLLKSEREKYIIKIKRNVEKMRKKSEKMFEEIVLYLEEV